MAASDSDLHDVIDFLGATDLQNLYQQLGIRSTDIEKWEIDAGPGATVNLKAKKVLESWCKRNNRQAILEALERCQHKQATEHLKELWRTTDSAEKKVRQQQLIAGPWELEMEFGQDGPGKLRNAWGIAVSPNGNIAVANGDAACVCVYSNESGYIRYISSLDTRLQGLQPERYSVPRSVPWNVIMNADGICYVTDETQYVKVYNPMGVYKNRWVTVPPDNKPSDTKYTTLCGLAMDANGHLLVGQVGRILKVGHSVWYISKHRQDGSHITSIKVGIAPDHLAATSQDTIIICDLVHNVQIVDNTGQVLHTLNQSRHLPFWTPLGVCCYDDIILIANSDEENTHEVTCFSMSGEYMGSITVTKEPTGITFSKDNQKLIVACEDRVQIYSHKM